MKLKSVNPYTEELNWTYDALSFKDCQHQIEMSKTAFEGWSTLPVEERVRYIARAADVLRRNKQVYAEVITKEMGKPIKESLAEVEKCAWACDYYAENAAGFLKDEIVETEAEKSYVSFEPLGVIFGIMPWNFPFWQVFRFLVPALAAGNVCLLKHASNVPGSALEIQKVFLEAGLPENVFKTLLIDSKTAMKIIDCGIVDGVSLTGSVGAGSAVGELAGKKIKPLVLELGGSDPFIVLEDADVDAAARMAVTARFINAGQSCIAAKRFIVIEDVVVEFSEKFDEYMQQLKVGDPMDPETDIGPVAKKVFVGELEKVLKDAEKKGSRPKIHGQEHEKGYFFRPALVPAASTDMKVCSLEIFGPIAPVIMVKDEDEAVEVANSTEFGLGAAVWSGDPERAERLAKRIKSGFVVVNGMVKSDPRLPFGGIKKSGVGRELSHYGLKEFVNIKTVVVNK
ncbi:NAD-dependent succinate-semialdehyde dehydrogenase [Methanosarcina sp. Mfa9]|uniref:NAD-dependent succinate-semialdehyde dehydrogenase n=1 Tax=Methanosarcina sp. Mfa9 TaxID=3439063 RepID=UPI003F8479CA